MEPDKLLFEAIIVMGRIVAHFGSFNYKVECRVLKFTDCIKKRLPIGNPKSNIAVSKLRRVCFGIQTSTKTKALAIPAVFYNTCQIQNSTFNLLTMHRIGKLRVFNSQRNANHAEARFAPESTLRVRA